MKGKKESAVLTFFIFLSLLSDVCFIIPRLSPFSPLNIEPQRENNILAVIFRLYLLSGEKGRYVLDHTLPTHSASHSTYRTHIWFSASNRAADSYVCCVLVLVCGREQRQGERREKTKTGEDRRQATTNPA